MFQIETPGENYDFTQPHEMTSVSQGNDVKESLLMEMKLTDIFLPLVETLPGSGVKISRQALQAKSLL